MKISVTLAVSQENGHQTFDLDDLNTSQAEWDELSEQSKIKLIQNAVYDLPDQPYWTVDKFTEKP